ncbi:ATP-binding cassette domain-containing protein [Weissella tructae]|uniref:ABC superfamily ATP binding cassette transporter ATP-binding and permease n=2 Tax=Weissella TaxID=46255 RepID=A0A075TU51_9LACO|nr:MULTISPECIES: ABC transporter ATP-binding protein/permease [Weissella]AIG65049.1 ABC superfamily ATP binding cassette transporter ATP-binding and permease [Weissella tructae]AIM62361.1 ABC superfamily ATP binding cassette transporter ATP-binding and permease [Weissella ceti]AIM63699.1 ABC superfamily ATP binding cassette transporter ATP-binding and permease [Weissella ceti]ELA07759.1 ABC transporter ATP-binding protein/permease [Weissella ceti NC36]QVV91452.1 ATP-binding cassette domain-con
MAFLELRDIFKSYYIGKDEFPVLKGIDLNFELGEFVSILGESGGGKSTLMNIIGGLDRNFDGQVTLAGQTLDHKQEKQLDEYRRSTIGYIYQAYNLINHLSVLDNVLLSLDMTTLSHSQKVERAKALLADVGLSDQIKKYPNQLSGGQKQRVAIARALAKDPDVIIADEPTGALDAVNTQEVLEILNNIAKQGKLVITVTHSQDVADNGTRIVRLVDGKIASDDIVRPYEVPAEPTEKAFTSKPLRYMDSLRSSWKHLWRTFGKNSLIIIGTAIGLFAVILFGGLGNGVKSYINDQVNSLVNPQAITVMKAVDDQNIDPANFDMSSMGMSDKQVDDLKKIKNVNSVEAGYEFQGAQMSGLTEKAVNMSSIRSWTSQYNEDMIVAGKPAQANEMVVDKKTVAERVDKKDWKSVIGKTVKVTFTTADKDGLPVIVEHDVKISGITENEQGAVNAMQADTMAKILKDAGAASEPAFVGMQANSRDDVETIQKDIENIKVDGKAVYTVITVGTLLSTVNVFVDLATNVLAMIAGISLIVSALMIIVTMYMSVAERTKEIGILRALGESKRDIRRLFTSESIMMGLMAATLATGLAFGLGSVMNKVLYNIAQFNMIQIGVGNVVSTFILALIIAFLAALLPARRAAKLNPIDALSAD